MQEPVSVKSAGLWGWTFLFFFFCLPVASCLLVPESLGSYLEDDGATTEKLMLPVDTSLPEVELGRELNYLPKKASPEPESVWDEALKEAACESHHFTLSASTAGGTCPWSPGTPCSFPPWNLLLLGSVPSLFISALALSNLPTLKSQCPYWLCWSILYLIIYTPQLLPKSFTVCILPLCFSCKYLEVKE